MTAPCQRYRVFLETLTEDRLANLSDYVVADVRFKDPFNDVRGVDAMARVFRHMFEKVGDIRFEVRHAAATGDVCLMAWRFRGTLRDRVWDFDGASVLRFADDGRVAEHIDYWDAATSLYEQLPIIGPMLVWLRRRIAVR